MAFSLPEEKSQMMSAPNRRRKAALAISYLAFLAERQ